MASRTSLFKLHLPCSKSSLLWSAGVVIPVDQGEKPETLTGRKLRPITLAECLVKFAEAVCLDIENDQELAPDADHKGWSTRYFSPGPDSIERDCPHPAIRETQFCETAKRQVNRSGHCDM